MIAKRQPPTDSTATADTRYVERAPLHQRIRRRFTGPETMADLLLAVKAVIAATAAWGISVGVLGTEVAFMAPWTALLTVHATVHRSLSRGAQATVASAVGMGLAFVIMQLMDVNIWSFGLALFIGLMGARMSWIRDEGVLIATTAIFILTADEPLFADRFIELLLGIGIGIVVNFLIIPPLKDQQAGRYVDSINRRMGAVLTDMAEQFTDSWDTEVADAWLEETNSMSQELQSAYQMVRLARESRRENPRHIIHRGRQHDEVDYLEVLSNIDESISHLRNLTRTMRDITYLEGEWDEQFRQGWVQVARDLGTAIADPDGDSTDVADQLDDLVRQMSESGHLPRLEWPAYGAMLASLRNIMNALSSGGSTRRTRTTSDD